MPTDCRPLPSRNAPLPIDTVLAAVQEALGRHRNAVLVAPPGAGKTTRVPLALLEAAWRGTGKILVLEPRRLAARAAAAHMAQSLGEVLGRTIGLAKSARNRWSRRKRGLKSSPMAYSRG